MFDQDPAGFVFIALLTLAFLFSLYLDLRQRKHPSSRFETRRS